MSAVPPHVQPYWLVHGAGPTHHRHRTKAGAIAEAERLARLTPGQVFVVLEAVEALRLVDVERVPVSMPPRRDPNSRRELDDDIPF